MGVMGMMSIFNIVEREHERRFALVVSGDLDPMTAPRLEAAVARACTQGAREVEIDLGDVPFIDSAGIWALLRAKEQCEENRAGFFIVPGTHSQPKMVFRTMGLDDRLPWREPAPQPGATSG